MAANRRALEARRPDHPALGRYRDVAGWLTGRADARAENAEAWLRALNAELGIPSLADQGLAPEAIPELARKTAAASSTKANPVELTGDDITALLQGALKG